MIRSRLGTLLICAMLAGPAWSGSREGGPAFWRSLPRYGGAGEPCTRLCVMTNKVPTHLLNAPFVGGSLTVEIQREAIHVTFSDEHGARVPPPEVTSARVKFHLRDGRILGAPLLTTGGHLSAHLAAAPSLADVCVVHVRLDRGPLSTTVTAALHPLCAREGATPCCAP